MAFPIPLAIGLGGAALGAGVTALTNPGDAENDFFSFMNRYRSEFFPKGFALGEGTLAQARERSREIVGAGDVGEVRRLQQLRGMGRARSADAAATAGQSGAMTQRSLAKMGADLAAIMEQSEIANRNAFLSGGAGAWGAVEAADAARAAAQQQFVTGAIQSLVDPIAQYYLLKDLKSIYGAESAGGKSRQTWGGFQIPVYGMTRDMFAGWGMGYENIGQMTNLGIPAGPMSPAEQGFITTDDFSLRRG